MMKTNDVIIPVKSNQTMMETASSTNSNDDLAFLPKRKYTMKTIDFKIPVESNQTMMKTSSTNSKADDLAFLPKRNYQQKETSEKEVKSVNLVKRKTCVVDRWCYLTIEVFL